MQISTEDMMNKIERIIRKANVDAVEYPIDIKEADDIHLRAYKDIAKVLGLTVQYPHFG